jgi:hypothetical protein
MQQISSVKKYYAEDMSRLNWKEAVMVTFRKLDILLNILKKTSHMSLQPATESEFQVYTQIQASCSCYNLSVARLKNCNSRGKLFLILQWQRVSLPARIWRLGLEPVQAFVRFILFQFKASCLSPNITIQFITLIFTTLLHSFITNIAELKAYVVSIYTPQHTRHIFRHSVMKNKGSMRVLRVRMSHCTTDLEIWHATAAIFSHTTCRWSVHPFLHPLFQFALLSCHACANTGRSFLCLAMTFFGFHFRFKTSHNHTKDIRKERQLSTRGTWYITDIYLHPRDTCFLKEQ